MQVKSNVERAAELIPPDVGVGEDTRLIAAVRLVRFFGATGGVGERLVRKRMKRSSRHERRDAGDDELSAKHASEREHSRTVAELLGGRAELVEHRQQQIRHRRVRGVAKMAATLEPPRGAARQNDR